MLYQSNQTAQSRVRASHDRELTEAELNQVVGGKRVDFPTFTHPMQYHALFLQPDPQVNTVSPQTQGRVIRDRDLNRNHRVQRMHVTVSS